MNLEQDRLIVIECVAKFNELAHFAPNIVPIDDARKRKFIPRLRIEIAKQIDSESHGPESYADAIQRGLKNES